MYGLILENIAYYIKQNYPPEVWQEILFVANVECGENFEPCEVFSEKFTYQLIRAAQDVTNAPMEQLMENIGYSFVEFTGRYEYDKVRMGFLQVSQSFSWFKYTFYQNLYS